MGKKKTGLTVLLIAVLALLGLAAAFLLGTRFPAPKRSGDARLRYAAGRVLCIGDSLTSGTCFGSGLGGADTEQRYAYYLGRMLNAEVDVAAVPGYSASDWYERFADELDFSAYDTVTIWFGTNSGPLDTLAEDVLPHTDPADYAPTETGWYCRIIEKIRAQNPDCLILLLNVYASKDEVEAVNRGVAAIAGAPGAARGLGAEPASRQDRQHRGRLAYLRRAGGLVPRRPHALRVRRTPAAWRRRMTGEKP